MCVAYIEGASTVTVSGNSICHTNIRLRPWKTMDLKLYKMLKLVRNIKIQSM